MVPGNWANTSAFNLPVGTFIITFLPAFQPGNGSSATLSNLTYVVSTSFNNGGTNFFSLNDARVRQTAANGQGGTYDSLYNIGIFTLTAAQATLYASIQFNYSVGGLNNNGTIAGSVGIYRLA